MTCKKALLPLLSITPLLLVTGGFAGTGCGNYSNEDLEFMQALPEQSQLSAVVPTRSAVVLASSAELYRMTRDVVVIFNGIVDAFLTVIDTIRAYPPTTRQPNERIWGPFPSNDHRGWDVRMLMTRDNLTTFSYHIGFRPSGFVGGEDAGWLDVINGSFVASGGARKGSGMLMITTAAARAAGLDPGLGYLDTLIANYDNHAFPMTVDLNFTNLPNPLKPDDPTSGIYDFAAAENGNGSLSFNFTGNPIPGSMTDVVQVTSAWLGSGEGRSDLQVVSGDAAGAHETQCWDHLLLPVYTNKPWSQGEDIGTPADCPVIPSL
jgi:hypothetical protein